MRTMTAVFTGCLLLVGTGLTACRSDNNGPDVVQADVVTGTDAAHTDVTTTDTITPTDTVTPTDVTTGTTYTITQLENVAAAGHPAPSTSQITVSGGGQMVALTTRLVSGPSAAGNCTYSTWVGLIAGGTFSAIEVVESETAQVPDGGSAAACDVSDPALIPPTLAIGDVVTTITGEFEDYCPTGSTCPTGTSTQLYLKASHASVFTVTNPGAGGPTPPPTVVAISDVAGTTANGGMSIALQNTLVTLHGVFQQQVPTSGTGGNHSVMNVSASATDTTNVIPVSVSSFTHASCTRAALATLGVGGSVGNVTGVLNYSFGAWTLQVTQASDLPSIDSTCATDAGTSTDATVTDATSTGG